MRTTSFIAAVVSLTLPLPVSAASRVVGDDITSYKNLDRATAQAELRRLQTTGVRRGDALGATSHSVTVIATPDLGERTSASASPSVAYACPVGYVSNPPVCTKRERNLHERATVETTFSVEADGVSALYGSIGETPWGEIKQVVTYDDGRQTTFWNRYYPSEASMRAARQALESQGALVFLAGRTSNDRFGWQLQYNFPEDRFYPALEIDDPSRLLSEADRVELTQLLDRLPPSMRATIRTVVVDGLGSLEQGGRPTDENALVIRLTGTEKQRSAALADQIYRAAGARLFETLTAKEKAEWRTLSGEALDASDSVHGAAMGTLVARWMTNTKEFLTEAFVNSPSQNLPLVRQALYGLGLFASAANAKIYQYLGPDEPVRSWDIKGTATGLIFGPFGITLSGSQVIGVGYANAILHRPVSGITLPNIISYRLLRS